MTEGRLLLAITSPDGLIQPIPPVKIAAACLHALEVLAHERRLRRRRRRRPRIESSVEMPPERYELTTPPTSSTRAFEVVDRAVLVVRYWRQARTPDTPASSDHSDRRDTDQPSPEHRRRAEDETLDGPRRVRPPLDARRRKASLTTDPAPADHPVRQACPSSPRCPPADLDAYGACTPARRGRTRVRRSRTFDSAAGGYKLARMEFQISTADLGGRRGDGRGRRRGRSLHGARAEAGALETIEAGARSVLVDLSHATFIDSTTLGVLMGAVKRLRPAGGELAIACNDPNIRKIFEITLLDRIFEIFRPPEEAIRHLTAPALRRRSSHDVASLSCGRRRFDERDPAAARVALDLERRRDRERMIIRPIPWPSASLVAGGRVVRVEADAVVLDLDLDRGRADAVANDELARGAVAVAVEDRVRAGLGDRELQIGDCAVARRPQRRRRR